MLFRSLQSLVARAETLVQLSGLRRYLVDYAGDQSLQSKSVYYWERVSFGLKPTLRLNHAINFRTLGLPDKPIEVVAVKQLYSRTSASDFDAARRFETAGESAW